MKKIYSLVLGGHVNGYSIIKELNSNNLRNIALFSYNKSIATYSNKINYCAFIDKTSDSLRTAIIQLKKKCNYIVIFPTDDLQIENLHIIYHDIKDFCFIPFNYENILESLDKSIQYSFCEKFNIPYPKTQIINLIDDLKKFDDMTYPVVLKPNKRKDISTKVFRSLFLETFNDYKNNIKEITYYLNKKITFLASEVIPGDDTKIFGYVGYRCQKGKILNEWIGKKLNQFPDRFGVFSSATNQAPDIVREQGQKLLKVMDLKGICQPEFKFDERDGKYKLMEINLRSMMWHRVGNMSGVNIQYSQYLDAIGKNVPKQNQNLKNIFHFIYMRHELVNLISRKGYWKHFKFNVFSSKKKFAIFEINDIKPFLIDTFRLIKILIPVCLKALKIR